MTRSGKRTRRLTIDDRTYLWSLRHTHHALADGTREGCCETLSIRSLEGRGGLRIQFSHGPERLVPDGYPQPSGTVGTPDGRTLNLHEPGTVRAVLDEAVRRGRNPERPIAEELDGWTLFDAVHKAISLIAADETEVPPVRPSSGAPS
ncbi:hypothetical protein ACWD6R_20025 [Streptomyces sp. NPDC005151]